MANATFGSGIAYLDSTFEPIEDRLECFYEAEEEEFSEEDETQQDCGLYTLSEVGYSFNYHGGLVIHSKKEKVEAIFKKAKTPVSVALPNLAENECGICFMESEPHEIVRTSCNHQYCRECIAYYLHLQSGDLANLQHTHSNLETTEDGKKHLRINKHVGVACPHPNCTHVIEGAEFIALVDTQTALRFQNLTLVSLLDKLHDNGELKICKQPRCGAYVQNCLCTSKVCRQRTRRLRQQEEIALNYPWLNEHDVRKCPKCGTLVEKNGGCDHMYCIRCKSPYNWSHSSRVGVKVR